MASARGGRRLGAGRPSGSAWKPKVSAMREETIRKMHKIVAADDDPLSVVVGFVLDDSLDVQTRMSAANICLPYLFPRLSATTVDAKHTVTHVDASQLLDRLDARIEKLRAPEPALIEAQPDDEADTGAGDEPPADG
jgi:hypothetical protein